MIRESEETLVMIEQRGNDERPSGDDSHFTSFKKLLHAHLLCQPTSSANDLFTQVMTTAADYRWPGSREMSP
jgi:hypothetical protein